MLLIKQQRTFTTVRLKEPKRSRKVCVRPIENEASDRETETGKVSSTWSCLSVDAKGGVLSASDNTDCQRKTQQVK